MSYSTLLLEEGIKSQFLAVIKPRIRISDLTLITGTKYSSNFSLGKIIQVKENGVLKTEASSSSLGDGSWYYDSINKKLYFDFSHAITSQVIVATYEIYLGTFDAHWNRLPNDLNSEVVYWEPLIVKSPQVFQSVSDTLFGFMPSKSSQLIISNATKYLQPFLYDSSFLDADIDLYHWLKELDENNIKLIFKGICGSVSYNDSQVTITILDRNKIFENEYREKTGISFFGTDRFPNLDPDFRNRPIRNVYGVVDGFIPVNIDWVSGTITTSDYRDWVCIADETYLCSISTTVPASPSSTNTRTYVSSVDGFRVGDSIYIYDTDHPGQSTSTLITAIGANYIDHDSITHAAHVNDVVYRSFVGNVKIVRSGVEYTCLYMRDYTELIDSTNKVAGFIFTASMESNIGLPTTIIDSDLVYARVYGHKNTETINSNPFGLDSTTTNNLTNGIVILYEILKNHLGLSENEINLTSFQTLQNTTSDELGFAVPKLTSNDFPKYRSLITDIAGSLLLKVFLDNDNKWSISKLAPITSTTKTIEDDEILKGSFTYDFKYDDILSETIVSYAQKEVSNKNQISPNSFSSVNALSNLAKYLHNISRQKTFYSLHFKESEAQVLANRLSYIFGERQTDVEFKTKNRFFDTTLDNKIEVSRSRMPGFDYDIDINRTRNFDVLNTEKSLNNITITMTDQKGIEDNSGSW